MTIKVENYDDYTDLSFANDENNEKLKLLVILSPIFIASFDTGNEDLEFLKKTISESNFAYGLYPEFFSDFDRETYWQAYEDYDINEDIYLDRNNIIHFRVNQMDDKYLKALIGLISGLIIDDRARSHYLEYFEEIRDDIVRNGRRSILANGIQGFYLSRYVVVWMLDLCKYVTENNPKLSSDIRPIFDLANNLQNPRDYYIRSLDGDFS